MIRVNKYLYENKCIKAKRLLEDILEEEPDCGVAHFEMGMLYYHELAEYDMALYHFDLCKRFKPGFIPVYHVTVQLLYQLNKHKTLLKYAESCYAIHEHDITFIKNSLIRVKEKTVNKSRK